MRTFASLDFETANPSADSACAVAIVRVEGRRIVDRLELLVKPPTREFWFTGIHGIAWADVADAPRFAEAWPRMKPLLRGVEFIAAHNASFDRRVLRACAESSGIDLPELPFLCTMVLARRVWNIRPTKLPDVCSHLGLRLKHHNALSDAEACARIVMAALEEQPELVA